MRTRPLIPGGRGGLLVLAVAAVPIVLNRCKPFAKKVGEKMVEWGEKIKKDADRPETTVSEDTSSNADMRTTPTQEETLKSASPAGKEEVKEHIAAAAVKKKSPPKPKAATPTKKAPSKAKAGTVTNPKKPTKKPE